MSETSRLFIALELPEAVRTNLTTYQQSLKEKLGSTLRWSRPEQFHITLHFLGDTDVRYLERIKKDMDFVARKSEPFDLITDKLGTFPSRSRPSVLWLGLEDAPTLQALHGRLYRQLEPLDESSAGAFTPHITLGRLANFGARRAFTETIDELEPPQPVSWQANALTLFASLRQGGRYEHQRLHSAPLGG